MVGGRRCTQVLAAASNGLLAVMRYSKKIYKIWIIRSSPNSLICNVIHGAGQPTECLPIPSQLAACEEQKRSVFGIELAFQDLA